MFIETYYDETRSGFDGTGQPLIPYPELIGEELAVWRQYFPIKHAIGIYPFELGVPEPVLSEVQHLRATRLFDRIEIWGPQRPRSDGGRSNRARGTRNPLLFDRAVGDAEITVDEVKRRPHLQEIVSRVILAAAILLVMTSIFWFSRRSPNGSVKWAAPHRSDRAAAEHRQVLQ
jgi:hypothetical protein